MDATSTIEQEQCYALSICQPWAWAIIAGHKRVENRSWQIGYRGPLVIHASRSRTWLHAVPGLLTAGYAVPDVPERAPGQRRLFSLDGEKLIFGAAIGVVDLVDIVPFAGSGLEDDPFASGPFCWIVEHPRRLPEPVPLVGQAGLFRVSLHGHINPNARASAG